MGPDIVAELRHMQEIDAESLPRLETAFDPMAFQEVVKQPKITDYQLSEDDLQEQGDLASRIRKQISDKADLEDGITGARSDAVGTVGDGKLDNKGRQKHPKSHPKHNIDGHSEGQLKI